MSLLLKAHLLLAWGSAGHRVTAQVAYKYLTPNGKKYLTQVLENETIVVASLWADKIRSQPIKWSHSFPYHYESISDGSNYIESLEEQIRSQTKYDGGTIAALLEIQRKLRLKSVSKEEKKNLLRFMVHFIGDIHQPLHSGRPEDRGGNDLVRYWFNSRSNLHSIWDVEIIHTGHSEFMNRAGQISEAKYAKYLIENYKDKVPANLNINNYLYWLDEMMQLRPQVYSSLNLSENKMVSKFLSRIDELLFISGLRIAGAINLLAENEKMDTENINLYNKVQSIVGSLVKVFSFVPREENKLLIESLSL